MKKWLTKTHLYNEYENVVVWKLLLYFHKILPSAQKKETNTRTKLAVKLTLRQDISFCLGKGLAPIAFQICMHGLKFHLFLAIMDIF